MKQDKQDRRSQRTRDLVTSAMMDLLLEKRYDAITVQDVLDRSGIGRSTFYAHYFDKGDVLASIAEQMLESFRTQLAKRDAGQGIVPSLELFQHIYEHPRRRHFLAMLRGPAGELMWEVAQTSLSGTIEQALATMCGDGRSPSVPVAVASRYLAGAFLNLFKWWLAAGMSYTPDQMDSMFQRLAMPGVWATLGARPATEPG
jgi:AcrR family transcriptional regulator